MCLGGDIACVAKVVQKFSTANCAFVCVYVCVCVCVCVYMCIVCGCVFIFLFLICFEVLLKKTQLFNTEHVLWSCYTAYCSM